MWSLLSQTLSNSFNYQCQNFFGWIEVRKLCHDVRWEMENPSCLARNAHTVPCGPPAVPEPAAALCPRGHQCHCWLRAAKL